MPASDFRDMRHGIGTIPKTVVPEPRNSKDRHSGAAQRNPESRVVTLPI
jgi:hypothetical protein